MKTLLAPIFTLALVAASLAESAYERELQQIIEQRDKALASASEPILKRFQTTAEQLLRRATQAKDLDASDKIKVAMSPDAGPPAQTMSKSSERALRRKLEGTKWIGDGRHWIGELQFHIENFKWHGVGGAGAGTRPYTVSDASTLQFYSDRDWTIKIAPDFATLSLGSSTFKRK